MPRGLTIDADPPIGFLGVRTMYYYEHNDPKIIGNDEVKFINNDPEDATNIRDRTEVPIDLFHSLKYTPPLNTGEYLIRGFGPNSKNERMHDNYSYWSQPYTSSNGLYSRGEFVYHSTYGFAKQRYVDESEIHPDDL